MKNIFDYASSIRESAPRNNNGPTVAKNSRNNILEPEERQSHDHAKTMATLQSQFSSSKKKLKNLLAIYSPLILNIIKKSKGRLNYGG